jgi:hypothetical protein
MQGACLEGLDMMQNKLAFGNNISVKECNFVVAAHGC